MSNISCQKCESKSCGQIPDQHGNYTCGDCLLGTIESLTNERDELRRIKEGYEANIGCGACAEGMICGSTGHPHDPQCVYSERDSLLKDKERLDWVEENGATVSCLVLSMFLQGYAVSDGDKKTLGSAYTLRGAIDASIDAARKETGK